MEQSNSNKGRKKGSKSPNSKNKYIVIRVTEEQRNYLNELAHNNNTSLSEMLLKPFIK